MQFVKTIVLVLNKTILPFHLRSTNAASQDRVSLVSSVMTIKNGVHFFAVD